MPLPGLDLSSLRGEGQVDNTLVLNLGNDGSGIGVEDHHTRCETAGQLSVEVSSKARTNLVEVAEAK